MKETIIRVLLLVLTIVALPGCAVLSGAAAGAALGALAEDSDESVADGMGAPVEDDDLILSYALGGAVIGAIVYFFGDALDDAAELAEEAGVLEPTDPVEEVFEVFEEEQE